MVFCIVDKDDFKKSLTQDELLRLLKNCDLAGASRSNSVMSSRTPSPSPSLMSIMCPGYKPHPQPVSRMGTPISTPLMRHEESSEHLMPPPHLTTEHRSSGVFSGSTLSLTSPTIIEQQEHNESPLNDAPINSATSPVHIGAPLNKEGERGEDGEEMFAFRRVFSDSTKPQNSVPTLINARPLSVDSIINTVDSQQQQNYQQQNVMVTSQSIRTVSSIDSDATLTPSRPMSRQSPETTPPHEPLS